MSSQLRLQHSSGCCGGQLGRHLLECRLACWRRDATGKFISTHREDGVTLVTLDDPSTRNALGTEMAGELYEELDRFESDGDDRVLVLTGRDPSFCSGANVRRFDEAIERVAEEEGGEVRRSSASAWEEMEELRGRGASGERGSGGAGRGRGASGEGGGRGDGGVGVGRGEGGGSWFGSVSDAPLRVYEVRKPTIAAVNGYAIGVGLGLALSCDIRVASERAEFAEAFVRMGLVPGDGSCWQLPRLVGLSNACYMQYTGDRLGAEDAYRMGLVSRVHGHEELLPSALGLARRLAGGATYSMSLTKYLAQESWGMGFGESLRLAQSAQELARRSEDHREAVRAFLEKRRPRFRGR